jgi:hypothetical protein
MAEPFPDLTTRLTFGVEEVPEVPVRPAPLPPGPGEAGCCPGSQALPPVPAGGPVPGSALVPGSGSQDLPEVGLGSRKLTWLEWLVQIAGHWTGLYAAGMKKRRQKNPPPPERLREHIRWVLEAGWNRWLPESCEWLRKYILGPVEGTYQILFSIPADIICTSAKKVFRHSVTGIPALVLIIYIAIRAHVL